MMAALLLLASFTLGLTVGLQITAIKNNIGKAIEALTNLQNRAIKKNTGVVRPGITTSMPAVDAPDNSKSAVVRPRPPRTDSDDTNMAIAAVRNRVNHG